MPITVHLPTALRRFTNGADVVECDITNLEELLYELDRMHPGLGRYLYDESGKIRQFINIFVNEEDIRFIGGGKYQFQDGDEVMLVPSIAGG